MGRLAVAALLVALILGGTVWYLVEQRNETFLQGMGDFLWVREDLRPADIVYVLGGDYLVRIPHAAELYRQGLAPRIVIPREDMNTAGGREHFTDISIRMLRERGVPSSAIFDWSVEAGVQSTGDEMKALRRYADLFPDATAAIVVTSAYHTRRAQYTAKRLLSGTRMNVQMSGVEATDRKIAGWWLSSAMSRDVWNEYLKSLYYVPRYLIPW